MGVLEGGGTGVGHRMQSVPRKRGGQRSFELPLEDSGVSWKLFGPFSWAPGVEETHCLPPPRSPLKPGLVVAQVLGLSEQGWGCCVGCWGVGSPASQDLVAPGGEGERNGGPPLPLALLSRYLTACAGTRAKVLNGCGGTRQRMKMWGTL